MAMLAAFLLFIALDILVSGQFQSMGMSPMEYFVAGMGFSFIFYYLRRFRGRASLPARRMDLFLMGVGLISCWSLFSIYHVLFIHTRLLIKLELILSLYVALFFSVLTLSLLEKRWRRSWLTGASLVTALRYLEACVVRPTPNWLWRYGGVMDLVMLFFWLMILMDVLKKECHADSDFV